MTLEKRIQRSAAELGNLLRQAEKKHRRFLKRRDAKFLRNNYLPGLILRGDLPKPGDLWFSDGVPIGFSIFNPSDTDTHAIISAFNNKAASQHEIHHLFSSDNGKPYNPLTKLHEERLKLRAEAIADQLGVPEKSSELYAHLCVLHSDLSLTHAVAKAASVHGNPVAIPLDNGKPFKSIGLRRAKATHKLSHELTRQVYKALEQIDSKLNAVLEIHGPEAIFQNPTSKIVFNVEISRIGNKFCNQVHYVIKAD